MQNRWNLAIVTLLVAVGGLVWVVGKNRQTAPATPAVVMATNSTPLSASLPPTGAPTVDPTPAAAPTPAPPPGVVVTQEPAPRAPTPDAPANVEKKQKVLNGLLDAAPGELQYTAQPGDSVSKLAATFLGSDDQANQDAIIGSNPSLQKNPDRIIAGQTYTIPTKINGEKIAAAPATPVTSAAEPAPAPHAAAPSPLAAVATDAPAPATPDADGESHELRYNARPGDSVSALAAALLGSDSPENRAAIIAANPALRADPDHVVVGQTYRIPIAAGQTLAAAPAVAHEPAAATATQPDADQLVQAGSVRQLRYTAKPGDTVSTLAAALLGSDTKENRDAIVKSNPSLKQDPDRVVAGKTYWIPAPTPSSPKP